MSNDIVCHFSPKGGLDDRIASILGKEYTKEDVGILRSLYDTEHPNNPMVNPAYEEMLNKLGNKKELSGLEVDIVLQAAKELMEYKNKQISRHRNQISNSSAHMAKTFNRLYHVPGWTGVTRRNRINMVATEFTKEVSRRMAAAQEAGLGLSREDIVNGHKANGKFYDGQLSIFESIFNKFLTTYVSKRKLLAQLDGVPQEKIDALFEKDSSKKRIFEEAKKVVEEYPKILANWAGLCTFARMSLRDTESLKLGQTLEYAAPTSPDNFVIDSPMEDTYNMEEAVKEAWMTHQRETSAYGSLGSEVRRFLSTITDVDENGNPLRDDLGYTIKMNPVEMHQYLAELLRGITSESSMIRKLHALSSNDPKVNAVYKALAKAALTDFSTNGVPGNPVIITQLLEDMHKNMVSYTALVRNRLGNIIAKVLNREANPLQDEFILRMSLNSQLEPYAIYDTQGNVNWEKLAAWYEESAEMLPAAMKKEENTAEGKVTLFDLKSYGRNEDSGNEFWNRPYAEKIDYLVRASKALGIDLKSNDARRILSDPTQRSNYLKALREFRTETTGAIGSYAAENLKTIAKYYGIRPSERTNHTPKEIEEYDKALQALKELKGIQSYEDFRKMSWGDKGKRDSNSPGTGNEKIYKMLDVVAKVGDNLKTERRVSWFDRKGKANSRYSDVTPSYMGDLVDKIHEFVNEGDRDGLRRFIEDKWGQSSFFCYDKTADNYKFYNRWIQELYDSITVDSKGRLNIKQDALAKVFQFDEFLGSNIDKSVSIFENFTEKQHAEAMLIQFLQPRQGNFKSSLAKYPCFILGDSGAQRFFTARHYSIDEVMNGLKDVFKQELEHQRYVNATNNIMLKFFADKYGYKYEEKDGKVVVFDKNNKVLSDKALKNLGYRPVENYSKTANEFTTLTFLNPTFKDGKYWKILTKEDTVPESKEKAMSKATEHVNTDALEEALKAYMDDAVEAFKKKLVNVGILTEVKKEGEPVKYVDTNNFFKGTLDNYHNNIEEAIQDFFWNTKYATIEQLQLFTVDPAFYDYRYPVKDLQKRYKEIYAPGKGISLEARDYDGNFYATNPFERVVYFDDISVSSEDINPLFWKVLEETFKDRPDILNAYKKNTLTDGQGYRTLASYRAVKGMAGEWTRQMEEVYQRIQRIRKSEGELTEQDLTELSELAVIFQPIKPYMYTLEKMQLNDNGDTALIPVQHKYAEIVLIPELMKEGKLRDIAVWMENHTDENGNAPIDMVCSTKCVKVGAFGSTQLAGANTTETINAALEKAYIHNLSWADYRIQSGVPEHLNHAQLFGTQIRKLILAGINKDKDYNYIANILRKATSDSRGFKVNIPGMGNVYLNGRNLISFYNCLIMANLFDSYDQFAAQCNTPQALSDKMIQNVIANANQAEDNAFGMSIIDDGENKGEFVIPPGEPGMEHDSSALLWSLFKKLVNKQKIKGGSAVQASAMGLSGWKDAGDLFEVVSPEGDNVLYDEIEMPFNVSYTSATGKPVFLKYEDWCNTDGTLKLCDGKEGRPLRIVYGDEAREYLSWPVSGRNEFGRPNEVDESGYDPNGYYVPLLENSYPGALDIIAYRIPTERDYSMINCKVFRFSNPTMGGTLKVPSSRTTTAGFDFDIDKLYFFMREFAQTHLSDKQIEDIWSKIYGLRYDEKGRIIGGNSIYEALVQARDRDSLGKDLLSLAASMFKGDLAGTDNLNQNLEARGRLFNYWEAAGLEGTPEEAFTKYLEDHRDQYPMFDTYNPENSPLNPVKDKNGNVITPGNTRAARNNMLMGLIRQRLMDKETLKARYTPGGFDNNRDAALEQRVLQFADREKITTNGKIDWKKVRNYIDRIKDDNDSTKDPEPEYDPSDPTAILVYNQQNQIAGKLIGIFANQNTNHVYASTLHEMSLVNPIKFGNHVNRGLSNFLRGPEGVDVDTNVAEYLAASVDAVKDPVLNFLNLNLITADAGALLARLGYTPQEIGLLFNQPIIKDLCDYASNKNVSTDVAILEMLKQYGGNNASLEKLQFDANTVTTDKLADNIIAKRRYQEEGTPESSEYRANQLQVLWLFNELMADTADLNSFVQSTRFTAANSVGSTWGDMFAQEERVRKFVEKYENTKADDTQIIDGQKVSKKDTQARLHFELYAPNEKVSNRLVSSEEAAQGVSSPAILNIDEGNLNISNEEYMAQMSRNPLAFEQCMMDLQRKAARKLFGQYYPYFTKMYANMHTLMNRLTKYGSLNADTINSLHREFIVYLLSKQKGSAFDGEATNTSLENYPMSNREYYLKQYPILLEALKNEGLLRLYPFFNMLKISGDEKKTGRDGVKITVQGMGGLQAKSSNLLTSMWADAITSDTEIYSPSIGQKFSVSKLAQDFYFYNFYHLGYNFHPTSSMSLTPTILKLGLNISNDSTEYGYIDFIRKIIKGELEGYNAVSFAKQYILNHLDNKAFVFTPTGNAKKPLMRGNKVYNEETGRWNNSFVVSVKELGDVSKLYLVKDESLRGENMYAFVPVIAVERNAADGSTITAYYMANAVAGDGMAFNHSVSGDGSMRYVKVAEQGSKGQSLQYFSDAAYAQYQQNGRLEEHQIMSLNDISNNKQEQQTVEDSNAEDGSVEDTTVGQPISLGTDVSEMFTDGEWKWMFNQFKLINEAFFSRDDMQHVTWDMFKASISDTSDRGNVDTLRSLKHQLTLKKKFKTIDENGNEIDVC